MSCSFVTTKPIKKRRKMSTDLFNGEGHPLVQGLRRGRRMPSASASAGTSLLQRRRTGYKAPLGQSSPNSPPPPRPLRTTLNPGRHRMLPPAAGVVPHRSLPRHRRGDGPRKSHGLHNVRKGNDFRDENPPRRRQPPIPRRPVGEIEGRRRGGQAMATSEGGLYATDWVGRGRKRRFPEIDKWVPIFAGPSLVCRGGFRLVGPGGPIRGGFGGYVGG